MKRVYNAAKIPASNDDTGLKASYEFPNFSAPTTPTGSSSSDLYFNFAQG
ncbi:MAG: hypothetical protein K2M43_00400 [Mycoplasmoidaceae bacterium]|nr:hypothetical protein [Mycoplasmoidaceae bacterium]